MSNTPFERIWDSRIVKDFGGGRALIHIDRHFAHEGTSARVARQLLDMGFPQVLVLQGGWNEWEKAGYPTEPK